MYWNRVEANWSLFRSVVKERWTRLGDEQLETINGRRDLLLQSISRPPQTPVPGLAKH